MVFGCDSGSISHPQFDYFQLPKRNLQQAKLWVTVLRICPDDLDGVVCSKVIRGCFITIFKVTLEKNWEITMSEIESNKNRQKTS